MGAPFRALKILFSGRKMIALAFFPGAFTFFICAVLSYGFWTVFLQETTLWLSIPFLMLSFLLCWLVVGNLSLLPVEDLIVDECQRQLYGSVKLPAQPLRMGRVLKELWFSLCVAGAAVVVFFLSLIPVLGLLGFVGTAWLTAYGFMGMLYAREQRTDRMRAFQEHALGNFLVGAFLNFLLFVPVLNVFLLGYAQVFAAVVYLERKSLKH